MRFLKDQRVMATLVNARALNRLKAQQIHQRQKRCFTLDSVQTNRLFNQGLSPNAAQTQGLTRTAAKELKGPCIALTIDRDNRGAAFVLSQTSRSLGASDAEIRVPSPATDEGIGRIAEAVEGSGIQRNDVEALLNEMYTVFCQADATHLELNALSRATDGRGITWQDSSCIIDDAAIKRQQELFALQATDDKVSEETEAQKHGLVYVRMDGNIGNVVNEAGLAMATNDAIKYYGGSSANFLDAGGQATKETMLQVFRIILNDERVKVILVNIYGGITRCDMIAQSIISAATDLGPLKVPIVARLQGTNSVEGLRLLDEANIGIYVEEALGKAAERAASFSKE